MRVRVTSPLLYMGRVGLARMTDLLFPPQCPISGAPLLRQGTLSPEAWARFHHLTAPWCEGCGSPFDDPSQGPLCASCAAPKGFAGRLTGPRKLDKLRSSLVYDESSGPPILALKYGDRHDGVAAFGAMMAKTARELLPEVGQALLVPVPLHSSRLRKRRYNQAGLLADAVGRELGLEVDHLSLRRIRPTPSQKGASARQRARNVAGAFRVADGPRIRNTHIILVDDVLTTGATLIACARSLRKAGALSVSGLTLARVMREA